MINNKITKLIVMAIIGMTATTGLSQGVSATWKQDSRGWWYTERNSWATGWRSLNGTWYYFGGNGYMKTGWVQDNGAWYYLNSNGAMVKDNTIAIAGKQSKFDSSGKWLGYTNNETTETTVQGITNCRLTTSQKPYETADVSGRFLSYYSYSPEIISGVFDNNSNYIVFRSDKGNNNVLHIDRFSVSNDKIEFKNTIDIPRELPKFGAATITDDGSIYILWGSETNNENGSEVTIKVTKHSQDGKKIDEYDYEAQGTNGRFTSVKGAFNTGNARIEYNNGTIVAQFARTMLKSSDGLNHQASHVLFLDENLNLLNIEPPYASHSFSQNMCFDGKYGVFADLGDVYPRGIQITKINLNGNDNKDVAVPYKIKSANPYQDTLTQLAGIEKDNKGYVLVASTKKPSSTSQSEPRNLFLQLIDRNFSSEEENVVISKGQTVSADNFTNKGVVWLTNYSNSADACVANPKLQKLGEDRYIVMWENIQSKERELKYLSTYYAVVTANGQFIKQPTEIKGIRLNQFDNLSVKNGKIYWVGSDGDNGIKVYSINLQVNMDLSNKSEDLNDNSDEQISEKIADTDIINANTTASNVINNSNDDITQISNSKTNDNEITYDEFYDIACDNMHELVNNHRDQNGKNKLDIETNLDESAYLKSKHMVDNNYFDHNYNGISFADLVYKLSGENINGENIAQNYLTQSTYTKESAKDLANRLFTQWKNSAGHNANMLNDFDSFGFGFKIGANNYVYATQHFSVNSSSSNNINTDSNTSTSNNTNTSSNKTDIIISTDDKKIEKITGEKALRDSILSHYNNGDKKWEFYYYGTSGNNREEIMNIMTNMWYKEKLFNNDFKSYVLGSGDDTTFFEITL